MIATAIGFNILAMIIGYLIGSINNSIIVSKYILKKDVRKTGSGNAGATNIARQIGFLSGLAIWFVDWFKVVLIVVVIYLIKENTTSGISYVYVQLAGLASLAGHVWPIFFKFKGGKGVSAMFGLFVAFNWVVTLIVLVVFWICVYLFDKVSVASIISLTIGTILAFIPFFLIPSEYGNYSYMMMDMPNYTGLYQWLTGLVFSLCGIIIVVKHTQNIQRVITKKESSFREGVLKRESGCKLFIRNKN